MRKRLPPLTEILPVFAVISTLFYGWTMVIFLWKVSGWLFFLHFTEIAGILAYQWTTNLLESLALLLALLLACVILPARFFKEAFVVRGTLFSLVWIGSWMLFLNRVVEIGPKFGGWLTLWLAGTLGLGILAAALATRLRFLSVAAAWLADRLLVFLFLLVPLSLLSLVYVILRLFL